MKKLIRFLSRDIVNTLVLLLTMACAVVYFVNPAKNMGIFFIIVFIHLIGMMISHYKLFDLIDKNVMDNELRVNVFHLDTIDSVTGPSCDDPWYLRTFKCIMLVLSMAFIVYILVNIIFF